MKRISLLVLLFAFVGLLAVPAFAQQAAATDQATTQKDEAVATVQTEGGVILLSRAEGPFETVEQNAPAAAGDRLMVTEESIAKVVYNDGCSQKYEKVGIYEIEPDCKRAIAFWPTSSNKALYGGIIGGALMGAAVADQLCDCKCPPISR